VEVGGDERRLEARGERDHREAVEGRGQVIGAVGRPGRGHEEDAVEAERLARVLRRAQVAEVDGVEGATDDAELHARSPAAGTGSDGAGRARRTIARASSGSPIPAIAATGTTSVPSPPP